MFLYGDDVSHAQRLENAEDANRVRVAFQIANGQMIACYTCGHVDKTMFEWLDDERDITGRDMLDFVHVFLRGIWRGDLPSNYIGTVDLMSPSIEETEEHYICGSGEIRSRDVVVLLCDEDAECEVTEFDTLYDACYHAFEWLATPYMPLCDDKDGLICS